MFPDFASAIRQTMFGIGGTPFSNPKRVPMKFTSLYRLQSLGITSRVNSDGIMPVIEMAVNPNSISFTQSKRITKRDTQNGSVFFHFTNNKGENNDILTMEFTGNTGNIDIRSDTDLNDGGQLTGANKKLLIWHNLWSLTRERMLLENNVRNQMIITYSSTVIPTKIYLTGHFSSVLKFTDNADKPFSRDYSMSFTVQKVSPDLDAIMRNISTIKIDTENTAGQT